MVCVAGWAGAAGAGEACAAAEADSAALGNPASEDGAYILTIGAPICLKGEDEAGNVAPNTRLHVFPGTEPVQGAMASLADKTVAVKGKLYGARSAKHKAPILMDVSEAAAQVAISPLPDYLPICRDRLPPCTTATRR